MSQASSPPGSFVRNTAGYFLIVLAGSLVASAIGGGFAAVIALMSPQFVQGLFSLQPEDGSIVRYAASVGMIWGLFIGVAVSCFACLLTAVVRIFRLRVEHRTGEKAS